MSGHQYLRGNAVKCSTVSISFLQSEHIKCLFGCVYIMLYKTVCLLTVQIFLTHVTAQYITIVPGSSVRTGCHYHHTMSVCFTARRKGAASAKPRDQSHCVCQQTWNQSSRQAEPCMFSNIILCFDTFTLIDF